MVSWHYRNEPTTKVGVTLSDNLNIGVGVTLIHPALRRLKDYRKGLSLCHNGRQNLVTDTLTLCDESRTSSVLYVLGNLTVILCGRSSGTL